MTEPAFFHVHSGLPRLGPGSEASTKRAISLLGALPAFPTIFDLGCGNGAQTLILARELGGRITAVDLHQPYLDELERRASAAGVAERIETLRSSMDSLELTAGSVDLIWSEGAIYQIGVERGLRLWRPALRPGGFVAFTEITWLVDDPPAEIRDYWRECYPAMTSVAGNCGKARRAGYEVVDTFALPGEDWWRDFYTPLRERCASLKAQAAAGSALEAVIRETDVEIGMYERFGDGYGYVFYVIRA